MLTFVLKMVNLSIVFTESQHKNEFSPNMRVPFQCTETVVRMCSVKKVFLEVSQNSQENTGLRPATLSKRVSGKVFSCECYEISKNTFFYKTPLVADSKRNKKDRSSHQRCSIKKKVFLEISQNSQENTCTRVSFLIKFSACNFIKKRP